MRSVRLTSRQKLSSYLALCLTHPLSSLIFKSREECSVYSQSKNQIRRNCWLALVHYCRNGCFHSRCISKITPRIVLLHLSMQHCCWQTKLKQRHHSCGLRPPRKETESWLILHTILGREINKCYQEQIRLLTSEPHLQRVGGEKDSLTRNQCYICPSHLAHS